MTLRLHTLHSTILSCDHAYEEKIADDREGNEVIFGAREGVKHWEGSDFTDEDAKFC